MSENILHPSICIHQGDCRTLLHQFPDQKYDCCITSPPYFNQRDYNIEGQIGLESSPKEYLDNLMSVFMTLFGKNPTQCQNR
jgi:DNA modification methylase